MIINRKINTGKPVLLLASIFMAVFLLTGAYLTSPTSAADAEVEEGGKVVFTFKKPKFRLANNYYIGWWVKLKYSYKTVAVTATPSKDYKEYSSPENTVIFPESTDGTVTVEVETFSDEITEGNETFKLVLHNPYYWNRYAKRWQRFAAAVQRMEQTGKIIDQQTDDWCDICPPGFWNLYWF